MTRNIHARPAQVLALGFGTTVAMWAVGYVAMIGPGLELGEALFALTLGCLVLGGVIAGRTAATRRDALTTAVKSGALSAVLNLLLIGSLIGGESSTERLVSFAYWSGGTLAVSIALFAAGAAMSWRPGRQVTTHANWLFRFACVAVVTVFLLLITGGLVTGLEAGLAVPDWPNSFGHNMLLYPLEEMVGGVYYEHAHRLYGMLVGITSITLAIALLVFDARRWLHMLGTVVLAMVCVQGLLGGLRVTGYLTLSDDPSLMDPSTQLAIVHGVFGQVVFAAMAAIAAFTSTTWTSSTPPVSKPSAESDRTASLVLVVLLIVQLVLGALYRHLRRDADDAMVASEWLYVHIVLAAIVTGVVVFVGGRAWAFHSDVPVLKRLGKALIHTVSLQLLLGIGALIAVLVARNDEQVNIIEVTVTTAHQATGAVLLAVATLTMLWSRRMLQSEARA